MEFRGAFAELLAKETCELFGFIPPFTRPYAEQQARNLVMVYAANKNKT